MHKPRRRFYLKKQLLALNNKEGKPQKEDTRLVWATWALVLVSGVLAFFTWLLYQQASNDSRTSDQHAEATYAQSKKQLELAELEFKASQKKFDQTLAIWDSLVLQNKKLVEANKSYTQIFRSSTEVENRAYISIVSEDTIANMANKRMFIKMSITNIGKTPAYNVRKLFAYGISDTTPDHNVDIMTSHLENSFQLGSNVSLIAISDGIKFTDLGFRQFEQGKTNAVIYGCVIYEDVFHNTHYTHCYFKSNALIRNGAFLAQNIYNDAN